MRSSSLSTTRLPVLHLLGNLVNKMIPRVFAPRRVYCTHPIFRITYGRWIVYRRRRGGVRAYPGNGRAEQKRAAGGSGCLLDDTRRLVSW
jgi:hypothetical protein